MIEGKYGFIDKLGNLVIPNRYEWADSFKDNGLASVKMEGKYGTIDLMVIGSSLYLSIRRSNDNCPCIQ